MLSCVPKFEQVLGDRQPRGHNLARNSSEKEKNKPLLIVRDFLLVLVFFVRLLLHRSGFLGVLENSDSEME